MMDANTVWELLMDVPHDCVACAELSPIEAELIAQARDIQNAEYQFRENEFLRKLDVACFIGMGL